MSTAHPHSPGTHSHPYLALDALYKQEIGVMCRDKDLVWHPDSEEELRLYVQPESTINLDKGYESFIERDESVKVCTELE